MHIFSGFLNTHVCKDKNCRILIFQVACVILLLNMARRFPKTAELWEYAESQVESYNNDQGSKWSTVGLVLLIVSMALLQTTFGTLGTALVAESHRNDSSILDAFQHFLEEYR